MDSYGLCPLLILTALYSTEGRHLSEITGVLQRLSESIRNKVLIGIVREHEEGEGGW